MHFYPVRIREGDIDQSYWLFFATAAGPGNACYGYRPITAQKFFATFGHLQGNRFAY